MSVVIGDDRDHRVLLRAFEELLGLADETLLPVVGKSNPSLTSEEIAIILRVQQILQERGLGFSRRVGSRQIQRRLLALRERRTSDSKIEIPTWAVERVRELSHEIHDGLLASGARIIGDADLLLRVDGAKEDRIAADRADIEDTARSMVAELEADGKLQKGTVRPGVLHRLGKVVGLLKRQLRG